MVNFIVGFDRLINLARGCDSDIIILDSLLYSAHGLLSSRMRDLHPDIKFKPLRGTSTNAYLLAVSKQGLEGSADSEKVEEVLNSPV